MVQIRTISVRNILLKKKKRREAQLLIAMIVITRQISVVSIRHALAVDTTIHTTIHSHPGRLGSTVGIHTGVGDYPSVIPIIILIIATGRIITMAGTIPIRIITAPTGMVTMVGIMITIIVLPLRVMYTMDTAIHDRPIHITRREEDHPLILQPIAVLREIQAIVPGLL